MLRPCVDVKVLPPTVFHAAPLFSPRLKFVALPSLTQTFNISVCPVYPVVGIKTNISTLEPVPAANVNVALCFLYIPRY